MEIRLHRTWAEIAAALERGTHPLNILQVVNLLSPRDWVFDFTFDAEGAIWLKISSKANLGINEMERLLEGDIPEVFACSELRLSNGISQLRCDVKARCRIDNFENTLLLEEVGVTNGAVVLTLVSFFGHSLRTEVSNQFLVTEAARRTTWFGSHRYRGGTFSLDWNVLTTPLTLQPQSRLDILASKAEAKGVPYFLAERPIVNSESVPLGRLMLATSPFVATIEVYLSRYGYMADTEISIEMRRALRLGFASCTLEIDSPLISIAPDGHVQYSTGRFAELNGSLMLAIQQIIDSSDYKVYLTNLEEFRRISSARNLNRRKEDAGSAARVMYKNTFLFQLPTSENETVALFFKLEGIGGLPFSSFTSVEYTRRAGIDALAHFQILPTESMIQFGSIEFEYVLENFFTHDHPPEQTDLIICWDIRQEGSAPLIRDIARPWLFTLKHEIRSCRIAVIRYFPGIGVKF